LSALGLLAFGFFAKFYMPGYLAEKGKNLATKEDIHHLTDVVEGIKAKYATDLEVFRAELAKANQVQQIQFKTEFETYVEIMKKLVRLQGVTFALQPMFEFLPESEEGRKEVRSNKLREFKEAYEAFALNVHEKRPFYSAAIWEKLSEVMKLTVQEANFFQFGLSTVAGEAPWKKRQTDLSRLLALIEEVGEAIRTRFDDLKAVK
jgi:hypothetical protein